MTPITITKSSASAPTPALTAQPTELACTPLTFVPIGGIPITTQRACTNSDIRVAIMDALVDKSRSDHCIATIFKNACLHD